MSGSAPAAEAGAAPVDLPETAPKRRGRRRRYRPGEMLAAFLCLLPSAVVFVVFMYYPLYQLFVEASHQSNSFGTKRRYVGYSNIGDVLTGSEFLEGLEHTLLYVVYTVPAGLLLGILLAVAAHRRLKGIKIYQTIFSSTVATSVAVTSVIFLTLINPTTGVLKIDILNNPDWALFGVSWSSIWQNIGLSFLIVLAGLQAIPDELLEAATLDGYGPIRRFFKVTLPLLSPVLLFLVVVLVVFALQSYAQVDILTQGGPAGATETLVYKITQNQSPRLLSTGAAMSIGLFGVTVVVTALQFGLLSRRVNYDK